MSVPTRLQVPRDRTVSFHRLRLDGRCTAALSKLRGDYSALLGRPVSTSMIVRRALVQLADHLDGLRTPTLLANEELELRRCR
jgi:hypothetical protein